MKATKQENNQVKLEMTLTKGKLMALMSALISWDTTLSHELHGEIDKSLTKIGIGY